MSAPKQLIIIYNATSTLRGKLTYAFNKLSKSSSEETPECAACDITHGGLSLKEAPNWVSTKKEIEAQGWQVVQWHRDEVEGEVKDWVKGKGVRYPVVLKREGAGEVEVVADLGDLAGCKGDARKFLEVLEKKGVVDAGKQASL